MLRSLRKCSIPWGDTEFLRESWILDEMLIPLRGIVNPGGMLEFLKVVHQPSRKCLNLQGNASTLEEMLGSLIPYKAWIWIWIEMRVWFPWLDSITDSSLGLSSGLYLSTESSMNSNLSMSLSLECLGRLTVIAPIPCIHCLTSAPGLHVRSTLWKSQNGT